MGIRFATLCSGIGCAELAADPLGWEGVFQSEIDPFASLVLTQRFPITPNLGDMTLLAARIQAREFPFPLPDVLIAGSPCQSFSIAGLGKSLDDPRGQITLELVNVLNAIDEVRAAEGRSPCVLVWENVPNVLSKDDNPFGCFLGALVGAGRPLTPMGKRGHVWPNAGLVAGPKRRAGWRILDAQYFGVPQRRRRLFAVIGAGADFDPAEVLLEPRCVRRDSPPRRETWQETAGTIAARTRGGGGLGTDFDCDGGLVPVALRGISDYGPGLPQLRAKGGDCGGGSEAIIAFGGQQPDCYRLYGANTDVVEAAKKTDIVSTLSARCEAVGNSGTHILAYGGNNQAGAIDVATARSAHGGPHGRLDFETETFLVQTVSGEPVTHALNTANNGKGSSEDGTGRGVPIIAFDPRNIHHPANHSNPKPGDPCHPLRAIGNAEPAIASPHYGVRRLTVVECERLQGLPDNYTLIRDPRMRKKIEDDFAAYLKTHFSRLSRDEMEWLARDGPRYKAIGNGMAIPVMHWILKRLDAHIRSIA